MNERGLSDITDRNDNHINDDDDVDTPKSVALCETTLTVDGTAARDAYNRGSSLTQILRAPNFEIISKHTFVMLFCIFRELSGLIFFRRLFSMIGSKLLRHVHVMRTVRTLCKIPTAIADEP